MYDAWNVNGLPAQIKDTFVNKQKEYCNSIKYKPFMNKDNIQDWILEDVVHDIEVAYKFLVRIKPELAMSTIFDNFGADKLMNTIPPSPTIPAEKNQIINFSDLPVDIQNRQRYIQSSYTSKNALGVPVFSYPKSEPMGIANVGQTCYLSVILQLIWRLSVSSV